MSANMDAVAVSKVFGDELAPGTMLCGGQYSIEAYLNSGGFGITYLGRDSLGRKVVIKECFPGAICFRTNQTVNVRTKGGEPEFGKILALFEKEARALSELQHPYIVGVHQIFKDNGTAYMALDFIEGRDLLDLIEDDKENLSPAEIKALLIKVLDAVAYMHDNDILHRDISPDNILLDSENNPVLIDFGAARESASQVSRVLSKVMTVKDGYSPQEFYLAGSEQAFSSDLYALAATFYHLITRTAPPSSQARLAAVAKKYNDPLVPLGAAFSDYDRFFLEAINKCLCIFPAERVQSARAWRDQIDTERRRRKLLEQARQDRDMELRISQLVKDSQIEAEPVAVVKPPKAQETKPAPVTPVKTLAKMWQTEDDEIFEFEAEYDEPDHLFLSEEDTDSEDMISGEAIFVDHGVPERSAFHRFFSESYLFKFFRMFGTKKLEEVSR